MSPWLIVPERGPAACVREIILLYSGSPGFLSGTGEGVVIERGLSFAGIAEEQKNTETMGDD